MDSATMSKYFNLFQKSLVRNSPGILTALGVGGLVATVIYAVKATPKAMEVIQAEQTFRYEEGMTKNYNEPISVLDTLELTWKFYIPSLVMGTATVVCMIGSNHIHLRRNAALVSLFKITETALNEYRAEVVKTIGEKKEQQIQDEIVQQKLNNNPVESSNIIITGKGTFPCFDVFSARYFEGDIETIRQKINIFNHKLNREGWLNINEFYYELGLEPIDLGEEFGWIAEYSILEPRFTTKLTTDGKPCLVLDYMVKPRHI